jgi:hypothetical protein
MRDRLVPVDLWNTSLLDSFCLDVDHAQGGSAYYQDSQQTWEVKESTRTVVETWIGRIQSALV